MEVLEPLKAKDPQHMLVGLLKSLPVLLDLPIPVTFKDASCPAFW